MPRDLFAAPTMTTVRSARRRLTIVCSTVAHIGVLALIVVVPLVSGLSLPELTSRLYLVSAIAEPPPLPPSPTRPAPVNVAAVAPATSSGAAPTDAPPTIAPEGDHTARVLPDGPRLNVAPENPFGLPGGTGTDAPILTAPPPRAPVPVGGNIHAPERVFYVDPIYPVLAQAAHVEGTVILETTIDERGNVVNTKVLRSVGLLDRAAIDAVSRWRYTPTKLNGVPVAVIMTVTVTFSMR